MNTFFKYFGLVVAALFILFGIYILAFDFIGNSLPTQFRIMMGIVLILYGVFRIVVTLTKKKNIEI